MSDTPIGALPVTLLRPGATVPTRAHADDAGLDLVAAEGCRLQPGGRHGVPTGISLAIPPGHAGLVLPRSGLARRHGVTLANAPGLIDSGYRGEVVVTLINHGDTAYSVDRGDRVAQLVVIAVSGVAAVEVDELPTSGDGRGEAGFGSSGR